MPQTLYGLQNQITYYLTLYRRSLLTPDLGHFNSLNTKCDDHIKEAGSSSERYNLAQDNTISLCLHVFLWKSCSLTPFLIREKCVPVNCRKVGMVCAFWGKRSCRSKALGSLISRKNLGAMPFPHLDSAGPRGHPAKLSSHGLSQKTKERGPSVVACFHDHQPTAGHLL